MSRLIQLIVMDYLSLHKGSDHLLSSASGGFLHPTMLEVQVQLPELLWQLPRERPNTDVLNLANVFAKL